MIYHYDPQPSDLVCPVCGEQVSRARTSRTDPTAFVYACANFHNAARDPITYQEWYAAVSGVEAEARG